MCTDDCWDSVGAGVGIAVCRACPRSLLMSHHASVKVYRVQPTLRSVICTVLAQVASSETCYIGVSYLQPHTGICNIVRCRILPKSHQQIS